jgi:hypothetical protein
MRNHLDILRGLLATLLGSGAGGATFVLLAKRGLAGVSAGALMAGQRPHGQELVAWLLILGVLFGIAGLYASWFDRLLAGPALVRGLKFGAILWMWFTVLVGLALHYGAGGLRTTRPLHFGLAMLASALAYGVGVALAYGAGRRYDEYTHGLGYGLPDRRSLA